MLIVPGSNFRTHALELAKKLSAKILDVEKKIFPDGEIYVRIKSTGSNIREDTILIANTMYPDQNSSLIETVLIKDAVLNMGGRRIILVVPYLPYMRQDKVFLEGEPVSANVIINILSEGIEKGITVDVHNPEVLKDRRWTNVLVSDVLVNAALKYVSNPVIIAPDKGAFERARYGANTHGLEFDYLIKERDRVTGNVSIKPRALSIEGRDIIIIDDIISTGGTIAEAVRFLARLGARRVVVAASHGLMVKGAIDKIRSAGVDKIILADTLGVKYNDPIIEYVDIIDKLKDVIEEVTQK
ncbi:ribose-phosphate diphosphokinase [Thermogladius sp. 4427co]|uniref:ribose-phosphate diphosphokinase n=1 Tax=Thermogladius sp. 4427co TaxID=3450718 RepID=UPI003F7AA84C